MEAVVLDFEEKKSYLWLGVPKLVVITLIGVMLVLALLAAMGNKSVLNNIGLYAFLFAFVIGFFLIAQAFKNKVLPVSKITINEDWVKIADHSNKREQIAVKSIEWIRVSPPWRIGDWSFILKTPQKTLAFSRENRDPAETALLQALKHHFKIIEQKPIWQDIFSQRKGIEYHSVNHKEEN